MTGRERLFGILNQDETDGVPVWLLFPYDGTSYYVPVRKDPSYARVQQAAMDRCITLNRRNFHLSPFDKEVTAEKGSYQYGRLRLNAAGEKLIPDDESLEILAEFPINKNEDALIRELEPQLRAYRKEKEAFPYDAGAMMLDLGEPINFLFHNADLNQYPIWSLTHNDLIVKILDDFMVQKRLLFRHCLENDLAEVYFLVGSELAAPPMVSVETFRQWVLPYAVELIEMIHSFGKKVITHFHGQINGLLDQFLEMRPDALHTIEAPPVGNCTMTEAFEQTKDRITLIGNVQYDDFRSFTEDRMRQAVRDLIEECRGHPFILSPSAGPFLSPLPEVMERNYLAFIDEAVKAGVSF